MRDSREVELQHLKKTGFSCRPKTSLWCGFISYSNKLQIFCKCSVSGNAKQKECLKMIPTTPALLAELCLLIYKTRKKQRIGTQLLENWFLAGSELFLHFTSEVQVTSFTDYFVQELISLTSRAECDLPLHEP